MAVITVPKVLREKLGEDGADSLIELINKADTGVKEDVLVFVEEKFERRLAEELSKVNEKIAETNTTLSEKIAQTNVKIAETKAEIIRWMFIFWAGQIGVMIGILFAFFKK